MVEHCYPTVINKLLRRYLKFKRMPEFDRLAAYADLWQVADDSTYAIRSLRGIRLGGSTVDQSMLNRISEEKRTRIESHITNFITSGHDEPKTQGAVSIGLLKIPYINTSRSHFRQLMDSTLEIASTQRPHVIVDHKKGLGYPSRRALLLSFMSPVKFHHQDHAGVLTRIHALQMEETKAEYEEYLRLIKTIKY